MIDTAGECIGQVNGLALFDVAGHAFGHPSRITATTRPGEGHLIDIQRETEMAGPIHTRGVLILGAFLAARYSARQPLSLSASLVFEQNYGPVDGDSATVAELCALLSSLSGIPVRQGIAVTGSMNQLGEVQPIGGVNEKIEGFFDLCAARGLTGEQGVLIPKANVKHLMLRQDVVEAAAAGKFGVYPVETVDEGIEVLYDDRDGGAGAKFKDAELIGCPVRVAVGRRGLADGVYEVTLRASGEEQQVPVEDAALRIAEIARTIT